MDERPLPQDEYEPDWQKITTIVLIGIVMLAGVLISIPCIILLWKAALRA